MKKNNDFVLNDVAGNWILVPYGENAIDFNGVITLNETAKFLWENCLEDVDVDLLKSKLIEEYKIDNETAQNAVDMWIEQMKEAGCIE